MNTQPTTYRATHIASGEYFYRGFRLKYIGYHAPDRCVWWEATDHEGKAWFHETTKRDLMAMIDEEISIEMQKHSLESPSMLVEYGWPPSALPKLL